MLSWWLPLVFAPLLPLNVLMVSTIVLVSMLMYTAPLVWARSFDRAEAQRERTGADKPDWGPVPAAGNRETAVVLIHGTFARDSTWTAPDAPLSMALGADVTPVRFLWSEANSMRSRRIASEGLAQCIRELVALGYPRVALIAHSHGGNIALKACEDVDVARHVGAIVCLSTPFISAWRPQLLISRGFYARAGMLFTSAFSCFFLLQLVSALSQSMEDAHSPRMLAVLAGAVVVAVAVGLAALSVSRRVRLDGTGTGTALDEDITGSVCDVAAIAPLRDRTLIITRGGDEADGVLKLASLLNRQIVGMVNSRTGGTGPASGTLHYQPGGFGDIFRSMTMGGAAFLGQVSSLAFGANGLRSPTGVFFTSAEIPPGQWTHVHLSGADAGDGIGLYHSSLYGDPQAIATIRRWVQDPRQRPESPAPLPG